MLAEDKQQIKAERTVTKRTGEVVPLDIGKIRAVAKWACSGLDCNYIELESGVTINLRDEVPTRDIQQNMILFAVSACSAETPDWNYVAGRLSVWNIWKDVAKNVVNPYDKSFDRIKDKLDRRVYDCRILQHYSDSQLRDIIGEIVPSRDLDYDYAGIRLFLHRYLLDDELIQEAYIVSALLLAIIEAPADRLSFAKKIYHAISQRKISLATPILANLRSPSRGAATSCYITAMDDTLESIFREVTNLARISKSGGGAGINLSRIRAAGSTLMGNQGKSGGVVPWVKIINDTAIAVNQGGRRAGAVTVALDIWHYDILEFLDMQTEHGDQRRKAYDVFPQVVVPDLFMECVEDNKSWLIIDPYEVEQKLNISLPSMWGQEFEAKYKNLMNYVHNHPNCLRVSKWVSAKQLLISIMQTQIETGLPYLAFKDAINRANPNKQDGYIPNANLCVESYSNVAPGRYAHCCNLVSINLANVGDDLPELCQIAVRLLDNTIEVSTPPLQEAKAHNKKYRTIGVGFMGLADWLAKNKISYSHLATIRDLFESAAYACVRESLELAKERGAFDAFPISSWAKGLLINCQSADYLDSASGQPGNKWQELAEEIKKHGIRNSHLMAIAPNTSSALVQGCTASILPVYSRFFFDKASSGSSPITPPYLKDYYWYYQENKHLEQKTLIDAVSTIQTWIDTGISFELLFNLNKGAYSRLKDEAIDAQYIFQTILWAWKSGLKTIYYVRSVQKDGNKEQDECTSCAN